MSELPPFSPAEQVVFVEDSEVLRKVLEAHGFDVSQWGVGPTKTVEALWEEVSQGETELVEVDGELVRRTYVAAVDVVAQTSDGSRYKLREARQIFKNGSERERSLITSLGEKIKPGENTEEAVRRAIQEELGIDDVVSITDRGTQLLAKASATFGGMPTQLEMRVAEVEIAEDDFRPEGYIEHQPTKSVYFEWDKVR